MISDQMMLDVAIGIAQLFELIGMAVIVAGTLYALVKYAASGLGLWTIERTAGGRDLVAAFRKTLGRSILTGLELLVAADIIRTVAVEPTMESVLVLGLIVLIRTFLSFSLEVEIDGKWPWQQARRED